MENLRKNLSQRFYHSIRDNSITFFLFVVNKSKKMYNFLHYHKRGTIILKRPFATIGFSMLAAFLLVTNISHKTTVAFLAGATIVLCAFLLLKCLRKHSLIIFSLIGIIVFTFSFIATEKNYVNEETELKSKETIHGVVCQSPASSDYAFTYIIKPDNKSYKIRFSSQDNKFLEEGDYVNIQVGDFETSGETKFIRHSLSSRVYFTLFESGECFIEKTDETNFFYKNIGVVRRAFLNIVDMYLPSENGAIAKAMTIGDESEIDDNTIANFKYCGTSHLLVISGLHLSLWSFGIMKYLNKFSKLRKISTFIGIACLLLYASITGFSVSVLRAGAMVISVLVARIFNRDADSINSIGTALTFILIVNPFAPYSEVLWLTTFSTLGILVFSSSIRLWLKGKLCNIIFNENSIIDFILNSVSISLSVTVFTLPIFVFSYKMIPVASALSNLLMVEAAMVLMVLTVIGVVFHCISLYSLARTCFFAVGIIGKCLRLVAEKIGMSDWSTISLDNELYKHFIALFLICMLAVAVAKRYKKNILTPVAVTLSVIFMVLNMYCSKCEYNIATVDVIGTESNPIIILNSEDKNLLVGVHSRDKISTIREAAECHNKKLIDTVIITSSDNKTVSQIVNMEENLHVGKFISNATQVKISDSLSIDLENGEGYTIINSQNKSLLVINCEKTENLFEKGQMYDIILLYGENASEYEEYTKQFSPLIYVVEENEKISVEF